MLSLSLFQLTVAGAVSPVLYLFGLVIYRLWFHPLAKFPGPKLAAATLWVEFYHDVVRSGMYIWEIEKMHKKYGSYSFFSLNHPLIPVLLLLFVVVVSLRISSFQALLSE